MRKVVLATGGFDPIHSGHINYFKDAVKYGDGTLIIGLNSDEWLTKKKGRPFMDWEERATIISNLHVVDRVINFDDSDGSSCDAIRKVRDLYPDVEIVFVNGGDRNATNIPEMKMLEQDLHLKFEFGVGGDDKKNSSSWILEEWKAPKTERVWGHYRVLHDTPGVKVKELTVEPGRTLSMQKHFKRNELWFVSEGDCIVHSMLDSGYQLQPQALTKFAKYVILTGEWHQLSNPFDVPCKIVEIQYGEECDENDIERKNLHKYL